MYTNVCTTQNKFVIFLEINLNNFFFYGVNKSHTFTQQQYTATLRYRTCHQEKGSTEISVINISTNNSDAKF